MPTQTQMQMYPEEEENEIAETQQIFYGSDTQQNFYGV